MPGDWDRTVNPAGSKIAQTAPDGCSLKLSGGSLEGIGNGAPRQMTVTQTGVTRLRTEPGVQAA